MNRINQLFDQKNKDILSIYFTAGHPELQSTAQIIKYLEESGVDMIEIGMPFSDPLADGVVIQQSSQKALTNGMRLELLFEQLGNIRNTVSLPLLLMGYLNPVLHFGMENFCRRCREAGVDGVILPDLPLDVYEKEYKKHFEDNGLRFIFLISPQTSEERIRKIDRLSNGFIYMVSSSSTTGSRNQISEDQINYFQKVKKLNLRNPLVVGFGISNRETFRQVCQYARGAIVGSAFVRMLDEYGFDEFKIKKFIKELL